MDQWKAKDFSKSMAADLGPLTPIPSNRVHNSSPESRPEVEMKDPIATRKVQKADREKWRRDRLNEQFLELGNTLDPARPKNDKATILTDTIQLLKDLTAEVNRLKAECTALSDESHELIQEKNELREEKASLKSDIENLNAQHQHRLRLMFPWAPVDPSVLMGQPYSYPVPVGIPPGPLPVHTSVQPFPFFGSQSSGPIPNSCSTLYPHTAHANPPPEQPSTPHASSSTSSKQDSRSKPLDHKKGSNTVGGDDCNDVATDLELKMPGSAAQQDLSAEERRGKTQKKERNVSNGSPLSRHSSSKGVQDSSCDSMDEVSKSSR